MVERADHELFRKKGEGGASSQQEEVTSEQQLRLQQIKQRDQRFDEHISQIGEGIDILAEMADQQNQEIQKQNVMLEDLQVRMDNVHEHVTNINVKMKGTLEKVSRSADKICVFTHSPPRPSFLLSLLENTQQSGRSWCILIRGVVALSRESRCRHRST